MRMVLIALLICLSPANVWATNWCNDANIVACWNIETGSGETLVDQSSNSNDGTFKGAGEPAWDVDVPESPFVGTSTYSIDFDGADDVVTVADSASLDISGAGMAFVSWIAQDYVITVSNNAFLITKSLGNQEAWRIFFNNGEDDWRFRLFTASGAVNCDTTGISYTQGDWHHISGNYDGTNMHIYWDGVLETTCGQTGNITTNNDVVLIGQNHDNATSDFEGHIDELAIFNANKTATDLNDMMDNGLIQDAEEAVARRIIFISKK